MLAVVAVLACLLSPSLGLYSSSSPVVQVTAKTFKAEVTKADELVLVEFYAPWCGHCKSLAPEWEKAAKALKGVVKVVAVDATESESLARKFSIQGFPTIKVFGAKKSSPKDYQGARTADGIIDFALKEVKSMVKARTGGKGSSSGSSSSGSSGGGGRRASASQPGGGSDVITLTDDTFDDLVMGTSDIVMVEFYAPWCGHCKNLAPEWAEAASQLKGSVKLMALDATEHPAAASRFGVRGYPTIKVFPAGAKASDSVAQDYNGPREAAGIVAFAQNLLEASGVDPHAPQLTSQAVWDDQCSGERICLVYVVPDILDDGAKGRDARLDVLKAVVKKQRGPWRAVWTAAGEQPALEAAYGPLDLPAVVAVRSGKKAFGVHRGSLDEAGLNKFCGRVMRGKASIAKVDALPAITSVSEWDGKDGVLEVEEEFSLDDIMGDDF